jgi:hypothetical protein
LASVTGVVPANLPEATSLNLSDIVIISQSGTVKRTTLGDIQTALSTAPSAVADPTFSLVTQTGFTVTWTGGSGAINTNIRYSVNSDMSSAETYSGAVSAQGITGLAAGTTYYVIVDAINSFGTTSSAKVSQITVPGDVGTPTFTNVATTSVTVSWTGGTGQSRFDLRYSVNSDMSSSTTVSSVTTPYNLTGLSASTTYYVAIDAVNVAGTTSSATASQATAASGAAPTPTYIGSGSGSLASAVFTASSVSIGAEDANRRVIVMAYTLIGQPTVTSATIGGVAATVHRRELGTSGLEMMLIFSAVVPTGITGNVVITYGSAPSSHGGLVYVFTVDNSLLGDITPNVGGNSVAAGTSVSANVTSENLGFVVGAVTWSNGAGKSPVAPAGYTSHVNNSGISVFSKSGLSAGTESPSVSWSGSYNGTMALAEWL